MGEGGGLQRQANDSDRNRSRSEREERLRSGARVSDLFSNVCSPREYSQSVACGGKREGLGPERGSGWL